MSIALSLFTMPSEAGHTMHLIAPCLCSAEM